MDHARGWVQQFHLGALRNNNTRLRRRLGAGHRLRLHRRLREARPLARFLDRLDETDQLAKTILYNLNPRDNELFATMIGNFQDGSVPGQDAVRRGLVVPRPEGRHGGADARALEHGPALALRRHGHRLAQLPLVLAPRVLPAPALQHAGRRRAPRASCPTTASCSAGWCANVCFDNARDYFGFPLGKAAE